MSNKKSWWWRLWNGPEKQEPAPKPQPRPAQAEPYVFITVSGKKFHYDADCPSLQNAWAQNKVIKMDLSKAKKSGRTACDKCCWDYLHD
jgi:hypothetical protein